jgi:hypothetical protein
MMRCNLLIISRMIDIIYFYFVFVFVLYFFYAIFTADNVA